MSMTATLKVQPKGQVTIPPSVALPNNEHSRAQRRFINRRLAKGLEDIRRDRLRGPFDSVEDMVVSMENDTRRIRAARKA